MDFRKIGYSTLIALLTLVLPSVDTPVLQGITLRPAQAQDDSAVIAVSRLPPLHSLRALHAFSLALHVLSLKQRHIHLTELE